MLFQDIDSEGPEPSDWDKYASEEYEILVAEETANEQLHEGYDALTYMHISLLISSLQLSVHSDSFNKKHMQQNLTMMCFLSPGHLMMTMNLRSFRSPERLAIKWKNWSYQTCRHKPPDLEFQGLSLWKTNRNKVTESPFGRTHRNIRRCKDRAILESPQNGLSSFCVCVTLNQYCVWCNNASVFIQKTTSLPPAPPERAKPTKGGEKSTINSRRNQEKTVK